MLSYLKNYEQIDHPALNSGYLEEGAVVSGDIAKDFRYHARNKYENVIRFTNIFQSL